MHRTHQLGVSVLKKAAERKIEWPRQKPYSCHATDGSVGYTSIDDAFASVMHSLATTTRQCKKFYKTCDLEKCDAADQVHCDRFHVESYESSKKRNPLVLSEDVHLLVQPGTYSVTASESGRRPLQKHVVHVESGQTVTVDFKR